MIWFPFPSVFHLLLSEGLICWCFWYGFTHYCWFSISPLHLCFGSMLLVILVPSHHQVLTNCFSSHLEGFSTDLCVQLQGGPWLLPVFKNGSTSSITSCGVNLSTTMQWQRLVSHSGAKSWGPLEKILSVKAVRVKNKKTTLFNVHGEVMYSKEYHWFQCMSTQFWVSERVPHMIWY